MRKTPLLSQVLAVNTLLVVGTVFAASVAARLDLGNASGSRQFLVLVLAILATLLANNLVMRRRFAPLESLTRTMEAVDLTLPGVRAHAQDGESADISRLRESFNRMLSRLEHERMGSATAVLRAQEAERARVARDLHDEVNQALAAVSLRLAATAENAPDRVRRRAEGDPAPGQPGDAGAARPGPRAAPVGARRPWPDAGAAHAGAPVRRALGHPRPLRRRRHAPADRRVRAARRLPRRAGGAVEHRAPRERQEASRSPCWAAAARCCA